METDELTGIARPIVWRRGAQAQLSAQDREDLLQEVTIKYLNAWTDGEPANVAAWFERTVSNAIVDLVRVAARRPADNFAEGGDDPVSVFVAAMRSDQPASAPPIRAHVIDAILGLVPDDADLLRSRYLEGHSAAEVAEQLGISAGSVDQRTTRATRRLRRALEARPDLVEELRQPHPKVYGVGG